MEIESGREIEREEWLEMERGGVKEIYRERWNC